MKSISQYSAESTVLIVVFVLIRSEHETAEGLSRVVYLDGEGCDIPPLSKQNRTDDRDK